MRAQGAVPATAACGYVKELSFVCRVLLGWCLEEVTVFHLHLALCGKRHHFYSSQRMDFGESCGLWLFFFFKPTQISVPAPAFLPRPQKPRQAMQRDTWIGPSAPLPVLSLPSFGEGTCRGQRSRGSTCRVPSTVQPGARQSSARLLHPTSPRGLRGANGF